MVRGDSETAVKTDVVALVVRGPGPLRLFRKWLLVVSDGIVAVRERPLESALVFRVYRGIIIGDITRENVRAYR